MSSLYRVKKMKYSLAILLVLQVFTFSTANANPLQREYVCQPGEFEVHLPPYVLIPINKQTKVTFTEIVPEEAMENLDLLSFEWELQSYHDGFYVFLYDAREPEVIIEWNRPYNEDESSLLVLRVSDPCNNVSMVTTPVYIKEDTMPTIQTREDANLVYHIRELQFLDFKSLVDVHDKEDEAENVLAGIDESLNESLVIEQSIDIQKTEPQQVNYRYTDRDGNVATHSLQITIIGQEVVPMLSIENTEVYHQVNESLTPKIIANQLGEVRYKNKVINNDILSFNLLQEVNTAKLGSYSVGVYYKDDPNIKEVVVHVVDTIAPTIKVKEKTISYPLNEVVTEKRFLKDIGIQVSDNYDKESDIKIKVQLSNLDTSQEGKVSKVQIVAEDSAGNKTKTSVNVHIQSTQYFIEANSFEITMEEYLKAVKNNTVDEMILHQSNAKAWKETSNQEIENLDIQIRQVHR